MKCKIMSIAIGLINGGVFSLAPLPVYNYLLNKNIDNPAGTNIALRGVAALIFIVLILNIILLAIINKAKTRASPKHDTYLYILSAWIIAIAVLAFLFSADVFKQGEYGERITTAFGVLCSTLNLMSLIVAIIVAKLVDKSITKLIRGVKYYAEKKQILISTHHSVAYTSKHCDTGYRSIRLQ